MKETKKSANWYIAATHLLTAGIAPPFLVNIVVNIIVRSLNITSLIILYPILIISYILAIWLGVLYSANYLKKTYVIENKEAIVNLSSIYLVVGYIALMFIVIISGRWAGLLWFVLKVVSSIICVALFYFLSMKYVSNTEVSTEIQSK
jgi:hypothetical protein